MEYISGIMYPLRILLCCVGLWLDTGKFVYISQGSLIGFRSSIRCPEYQAALLLAWINFNPSIDKQLHPL